MNGEYMFNKREELISGQGVGIQEIVQAEKTLNLAFAEDYKCYLKNYGAVMYDGHEFTGITSVKRINVVDVTMEERERHNEIPQDWYVIEKTNIDGIVIWQNTKGEIYQSDFAGQTVKIFDSLSEYIREI